MKLELKRIDPLRAANVVALVEGLLMAAFVLIFAPFFLVAYTLIPEAGGGVELFFMLFVLILYPVIGVVFGWICGLLAAAIYNLVIRWSGGLLFEFDSLAG